MKRFILGLMLWCAPTFAQEWNQVTGPDISLQSTQITSRFIAPAAFQFGSVTASYTHTINNRHAEMFVDIPMAPSPISGEPFYGMKLESITGNHDGFTVTTTGAVYEIGRNSVQLIRRIDPLTNTYNPRHVARITFNDIGKLQVIDANSESCKIISEQLAFEIFSDSAMLIAHCDCPGAVSTFSYSYSNLLTNAPQKVGPGTERFWTDGYGGSLHAQNPVHQGSYVASNVTEDSFTITLGIDAGSFVAVFPPKQFDFEYLYGANSRPHVWFAGVDLAYTLDNLQTLKDQGFGVIMPWAGLYNGPETGLVDISEKPIYDEDAEGNRSNYRYEWDDPVAIQAAIDAFQAEGFKVIPYFSGWWWSLVASKQESLTFMRSFMSTYNFDGWYFDNAGAGANWMEDYLFMKQVRRDIGDDGIIYHHNSVDLWAGLARDGRVLVPADAYANYTLKGETGTLAEQIHDPNDPYLRFVTSGYGMAQTLGTHKLTSNGQASLNRRDLRRATGQNYNGSSRSHTSWTFRDPWENYFYPAYLQRQTEYLSGDFTPDVSWPLDWWFAPTNIAVTPTENSAAITWSTPVPSDSLVRYALPDESIQVAGISNTVLTDHYILVPDLLPNQEYRFSIRSTDGQRVWGYYGTFTTLSPPGG